MLFISPAGPSPAYYFYQDTSWTPPAQDPFAYLNVAAGGSVHLDLGSIVLGMALPIGSYTTDIGVYSSGCFDPSPGGSGLFICLINYPYLSPPDFADAGLLTIVVTEAPEPATALLLGAGLLGMAAIRRKAGAKAASYRAG